MIKQVKLFIMVGVILIGSTLAVRAVAITFVTSAVMPAATGAAATVSSVNAACAAANGTNCFTPVSGTNPPLPFGNLSLVSVPANGNTPGYSYFAPDHFYAIDVAPIGGAGSVNITLSYLEGTKPPAQTTAGGSGLGKKASIAWVKVKADATETVLGKKVLSALPASVSSTAIAGGFFRAYVGIVTNPSDAALAGQNAEIFSTADAAGTYNGTLTVTYVLA
jgi:hypothetical protein